MDAQHPEDSEPQALHRSQVSNFIRAKIDADLRSGKYGQRVVTRFPPEPNGYLHVGHAKSICLNFGIARDYHAAGVDARCHLRFDDTNPTTEDMEYVESIQRDIAWLGFDWGKHLFYASDYFDQLFEFAIQLIRDGKAYVDSSSEEEIRTARGTLSEPGVATAGRSRSVEENLDLFLRMKNGEFPDGAHVLRARGDLTAANMKMRDPLLYRIRHAHHYRTGDKWCIYPMYDYAHCVSDALEKITHSICTLEFENNRDIYDWVLRELRFDAPPEQTEFARLNLASTITSKRKLLELVREKHVSGWDDPRMPTIAGMRRRGYTPASIRNFCDRIGVAKANSTVDFEMLEYCVREDLNLSVPRVMAVQKPLKVVLDSLPAGEEVVISAPYWPAEFERSETRELRLTREIWIDASDFEVSPPKGFHRLYLGGEVRLRHACLIRCTSVETDEQGNPTVLHCEHDAQSFGKAPADGRKVKGTIQWVSAVHGVPAKLRLYDRLLVPDSERQEDGELRDWLAADSLTCVDNAIVEPSLANSAPGSAYQFERIGYFCADLLDHAKDGLVFNRTVGLRDTWDKQAPKAAPSEPTTKEAKVAVAPASARSDERARPVKASKTEIKHKLLAQSPEAQALALELADAGKLSEEDAELVATDATLSELYLSAKAAHARVDMLATWLVNDIQRELRSRDGDIGQFTGEKLSELLTLVESGELTSVLAKEVLGETWTSKESPREVVLRCGLSPIRDPEAIVELLRAAMAQSPKQVAAFRAGNVKLAGYFVGQVMKASSGRADPQVVQSVVSQHLAQEAGVP